MQRYFRINGYWKDNWEEFTEYLVTESEEITDDEDIHIFYYGLTEELIKEAIKLVANTDYEFVITAYKEVP